MNKIVVKVIGLLCIFLVIGIILYALSYDNTSRDEKKFKDEYESLNGKKNDKGKEYMAIEIPKDNNVTYADFSKTMDFLENGTGVLYLGFPECPWCRNAVPILIKTALENEINDIYYFNALSIRDIKELKDGKVVTTKKGTKDYYKLVDKLSDFLTPYEGLNDDSIKRIYFPTAIFVQGGKIVGSHIGTVDSQEDPYRPLTKLQKKELKKIYTVNINKIYGACDDSC
ncbi:MAG: hypothetical protein IKE75_04710 [Bacilli bacterium]|nr:hypothetical protein [Bacilli bacterium]